QALEHALGQDHHLGAVLEQLRDVGRLDAGHVARAGLAPVPFARAAGVQFGVLERAVARDLDLTPGQPADPGRRRLLVHGRRPAGRRDATRAAPARRGSKGGTPWTWTSFAATATPSSTGWRTIWPMSSGIRCGRRYGPARSRQSCPRRRPWP